MPPLFLDFFLKLSEFTVVNFFYLNPSREYWSEQYSDFEAARLVARDGGTLEQFHDGNPLLASFGAQGREFFRHMAGMPEVIHPEDGELFEPFLETSGDGPDDYVNPTRLTALQQDIHAMFRRGPEPDGEITGRRFDFPPQDRTIRVHNCHSARREIEVLHDQLLELLENPELQPRDIIVMAPDINTYMPYIRSIFGQGPLKNVYAVSDRSLRRTSRIADAFFELLKLRHSRFEASKVLDLLHVPAIRSRFGIEAADLGPVADWIERAGIRWGVDRSDRLANCTVGFEEYSWRQGLDRLLLGFARETVPEDLHSDGAPAAQSGGGKQFRPARQARLCRRADLRAPPRLRREPAAAGVERAAAEGARRALSPRRRGVRRILRTPPRRAATGAAGCGGRLRFSRYRSTSSKTPSTRRSPRRDGTTRSCAEKSPSARSCRCGAFR